MPHGLSFFMVGNLFMYSFPRLPKWCGREILHFFLLVAIASWSEGSFPGIFNCHSLIGLYYAEGQLHPKQHAHYRVMLYLLHSKTGVNLERCASQWVWLYLSGSDDVASFYEHFLTSAPSIRLEVCRSTGNTSHLLRKIGTYIWLPHSKNSDLGLEYSSVVEFSLSINKSSNLSTETNKQTKEDPTVWWGNNFTCFDWAISS